MKKIESLKETKVQNLTKHDDKTCDTCEQILTKEKFLKSHVTKY